MQILAFPEYLPQARRLAESLDVPLQEVVLHRFPDEESLLRLPTDLTGHVVFCRSLNQPNDKLVELMLAAQTARQLGADRLTLVAPYMCYMRQDIANQPGEAVSQRIVGGWLAQLFDDVITVDPHLHRISSLDQAIPLKHAVSLTATEPIADFLRRQLPHALLLGPDEESEQWVAAIAGRIGFEYAVATKRRTGDKQVAISLPEIDFNGKIVVLVDDMASTGRTLARAAEGLSTAGAKQVHAVVTHALFCGDAERQMRQAGVERIWSSDSIAHPSACIHLDKLLAGAVREISTI